MWLTGTGTRPPRRSPRITRASPPWRRPRRGPCGGLVDRKRPFTLLRVSGTQVGVLSRVVMLEAAVPLLAATVVAAGIAYGTSILAFVRLAPAGTAIPQLGSDYYALMGIGLAVAFGVIAVTLPLLRRMTSPGNVRFE